MFDQITLPGGLRVVGERLTHVRSCTVGCWVKVGSMNELPEENGLSHFIEHMVFKGTQTRSARAIAEEMDEVGGQLNAFTGKDCTCFYAKVIAEDLRLAVDLIADLALRPRFEDAELQKERGVVLEEIAMVEDTPEDLVADVLSEAQFEGSLSRPILGSQERIRAYTRSDLLAYWRRHYTADNMVVAVAGNYDWDAFLAMVGEYFTAFPAATGTAIPAAQAQRLLSGRAAREKDTEQLQLSIGYPGVAIGSDDLYALSVFNNALGGGMSSRLFQRIREELGMAYSVYTYPTSYPGCGTFTLYAGTSPENGEVVLAEMQNELAKVLADGFSEKEFRSAKAQLKSGFVMGMESSSGRMQAIGRSLLLLGRPVPPEETLAKIDAVTLDDVLRVGRQALAGAPSAAVVGKDAARYLALIGGENLG